jgi:hypothetical protein
MADRTHFREIREFALAYWNNWFAIMSGGPSVPAAVLAFFVESDTAKSWLWATAAFCIILSSFFVWRTERRKVDELQEQSDTAAAQRDHAKALRQHAQAIEREADQRRSDQDPMRQALLESQREAISLARRKGMLKIRVGNEGAFCQVTHRAPVRRDRLLKVRVENSDNFHTAKGCRVEVVAIEPKTESGSGPWPLAEAFDLSAGANQYVQFAAFGERYETNPNSSPDSVMQICSISGTVPYLGVGFPHKTSIRVTAHETPAAEITCVLKIDESGHLIVEECQ